MNLIEIEQTLAESVTDFMYCDVEYRVINNKRELAIAFIEFLHTHFVSTHTKGGDTNAPQD